MLACAAPVASFAKPPEWAPAHGWRKKHDPYYVGYAGRRWPDDFGILAGRCNRSAIGAVVGGAVGGAVGASVGRGDARGVAVVLGTVVGAVVGSEIGRAIDDEDRGCIGHSLELARTGQTIRWTNADNGVGYTLTPTRNFDLGGRSCRVFTTRLVSGGVERSFEGKACRSADGTWDLL